MFDDDTITDEEVQDEVTGEQPAGEMPDGEQTDTDTGAEDGEITISIGDEPAQAEDEEQNRAPEWVRELRKSNREKDRVIRELQAKVSAPAAASAPAVLGPRPTLADCGYDEDAFTEKLDAWHAVKRDVDQRKTQAEQAEQQARQAWQTKLDAYGKAKGALKVSDFDDAEAAAQDSLSVVQQGVILNGAENPALLVYALGKNPKKAKELAAITDPVKFAFAVAKLETQLKVAPKKTAPAPERTVRGSAPSSGAVDSTLARLRADAEKTGNYTKVMQYRAQQKAKSR